MPVSTIYSPTNSWVNSLNKACMPPKKESVISQGQRIIKRSLGNAVLAIASLIETAAFAALALLSAPCYFFKKDFSNWVIQHTKLAGASFGNAVAGIFGRGKLPPVIVTPPPLSKYARVHNRARQIVSNMCDNDTFRMTVAITVSASVILLALKLAYVYDVSLVKRATDQSFNALSFEQLKNKLMNKKFGDMPEFLSFAPQAIAQPGHEFLYRHVWPRWKRCVNILHLLSDPKQLASKVCETFSSLLSKCSHLLVTLISTVISSIITKFFDLLNNSISSLKNLNNRLENLNNRLENWMVSGVYSIGSWGVHLIGSWIVSGVNALTSLPGRLISGCWTFIWFCISSIMGAMARKVCGDWVVDVILSPFKS